VAPNFLCDYRRSVRNEQENEKLENDQWLHSLTLRISVTR
jgi:hypothetical protein